MFDIMNIAADETAFCHAKDAKGNLLFAGTGDAQRAPVGAVMYGPGSDAAAALETKMQQRAQRRIEENGGKQPILTPEQRRADRAEDLADITKELRNVSHAGKTGRDLMIAVYSEPKLGFLAQQFDRFAFDWGNFAPASSGN